MKFVYKSHFKFRARQRGISLQLIKEIYKKSSARYIDQLTDHHIVVCRITFQNRIRNLMVAYDRIGDTIEFVTTHVIREKEIKNKVNSGRWKHEQN